MEFFRNKILYTVAAFLVSLSLVAYSWGFYSVSAAEISTLPADIDITVSYDSDNVNWIYNGKDYTFSRSYPLTFDVDGKTMYFGGSSNDSTFGYYFRLYDYKTSDFLVPTVESRSGVHYNASYWFSPSEDSLYIHCTAGSGSEIQDNKGFIRSYFSDSVSGRGSFSYFRSGSYWPSTYVYRYDFNTGLITIGGCQSNSGMTAYFCYDLDSGFSLKSSTSTYDLYQCNSSRPYDAYLPSDLLCLYSSYAISGFYQPDTSKVVTPDYYMQYQYIFYRDGKGYTFIDSGERLTEVTAQGSYAYLTFADSCNKYIYTSVDGIDWTMQTTLSNMYGGTYTSLAYDWLYDKVTVGAVNQYNAELVYTNDDNFGKPIIKPEWADLQEVIDSLPSFTDIDLKYLHQQYFTPSSSFGSYSSLDDALLDLFHGAYVVGNDLEVPMVSNVIQRILSWVTDDVNDWSLSYSDSLLMMLLNEFTSDVSFDYTGTDSEGNMWYEARPSILNYIATISNNVYKMQSYFKNFIIIIDSRLGSIFDNITLTNTNLSGISDKLGKLPDYSAALRDISGKLDILDYNSALSDIVAKLDTLVSSGSLGSSPSEDYSDYFLMLDARLEQLNYNLFGDDILFPVSAFSLSSADTGEASGLGFDDRIVDSLKRISNVLGNHNVPNSISSDLYDIKLDQEHIFDQLIAYFPEFLKALNNLSDTDTIFREDDDDKDFESILNTIIPIVNNVVNSVYIGQLLSFTDEVSNGIDFINGIVSGIYGSLGPSFSKVVLLGAGFTLIAVVIRKERAT